MSCAARTNEEIAETPLPTAEDVSGDDGPQGQGADQSKTRRECRYQTDLFKDGHDVFPMLAQVHGEIEIVDSVLVCSVAELSTA